MNVALRPFRVASLFSGGGGLDLGLHLATRGAARAVGSESSMKGVKGTTPVACSKCGRRLTARWRVPRGSRPGFQGLCRLCRRVQAREAQRRNAEAHNLRCRVHRAKTRAKILEAYGGKCACCGEARSEFLALDHVNGGGARQRRNGFSTSGSIYRHAIRLGFPDTFRLLCHNCNSSLGFYGYCPHARERDSNGSSGFTSKGGSHE